LSPLFFLFGPETLFLVFLPFKPTGKLRWGQRDGIDGVLIPAAVVAEVVLAVVMVVVVLAALLLL
jgi:hypothetical protein